MKYYLSVLKNYATFTGRARRKEYWMFALFNLIFLIVAAILDNIIGYTFTNPMTAGSMPYGYIYVLYSLFVFIPGLAVGVRRLHDVGKSGWFLLVGLVPVAFLFIIPKGEIGLGLLVILIFLAGVIWLLVLNCTDSIVGPNKYGPNPKGIGNDDQPDFMKTSDVES